MFEVNADLIRTLGIRTGSFDGRTTLITGSARGIGEATAVNLAHLGAKVVIVDILPEGREVVSAISHTGGEAVFVQCDISDPARLADTMSRVETGIGNVGILINNALHMSASPLVELSLVKWDKTLATEETPLSRPCERLVRV